MASWHQSITQPLCRCCGKPIPKHTETVFVRDPGCPEHQMVPGAVAGPLHSKDECRERTSQIVINVRFFADHVKYRRRVSYFTTWDGVSYADQFFCSGPCRDLFAYACASDGRCLPPYNAAMRRLRDIEPAEPVDQPETEAAE